MTSNELEKLLHLVSWHSSLFMQPVAESL